MNKNWFEHILKTNKISLKMHLMNLDKFLLDIHKTKKENTFWFPYYSVNIIWKPLNMIHNINLEQGRQNELGQWGCISTKTLEKID